MKISKNYKFNIPEFGDVADITKVSENFEKLDETVFTIEQATRNFDALAETYGYTYKETEIDGVTTYVETVKEGCPIVASRTTTESVVSESQDKFSIKIILGDKTITQTVLVTDGTADMVVS